MASGQNDRNQTKESLDKLKAKKQETEEEVDELQAEFKQLQAEYEKKLQTMKEEGNQEVQNRIDRARIEISNRLDSAMSDSMNRVTDKYSEHATDKIKTKSTDVLRMNKIFRDVSRCLGANWRPVYDTLTIEFPPNVTDNELRKIEQQKPFMQAFKALNSWKDLCGNNFQLTKLAEALKACSLPEIADMVYATLTSEGEELMRLSHVGQGIAPGIRTQSSIDGESGAAGASGVGAAAGGESTPAAQAQGASGGGATGDALSDRRLLQLAKKIGGSWMDLGRALQFPDDELQEILQNEGMSYQGAFKVLWGWRDRNEDAMYQDNITLLQTALRKTGREELADSLSK